MSDSDAIHHTGSGAVQDSGADTLSEPTSAASEGAPGMPTANTIAAQASAPASVTNVAATSEMHALAPTVTDTAGHSKPSLPGTAGTSVPDETAVHAAIKDSNPASTAATSHTTGASEAAATQVSPHGSNAAADSKGAAASAAADSTAVQVPIAHGASTAPSSASAPVVNAPIQTTSIASPGKLAMLCSSTVVKLFTLRLYSDGPVLCFVGVAGSIEQQNATALQSGVNDMEQ